MKIITRKKLKKTDVEKRFHVPSKKKQCLLLDFGGEHMVEFEVTDENGKGWSFECSKRKKGEYPKPVLSKGWLPFVSQWKLAVGDEVIFYKERDKAGKWRYRIKVIKRANQPPDEDRNADRIMKTASYGNTEEEPSPTPTITFNNNDRAIKDDQTEEVHYQPQPATAMVGSVLALASAEPQMQVREPEFIDFFERAKEQEQPSTTMSSIPFYQFL